MKLFNIFITTSLALSYFFFQSCKNHDEIKDHSKGKITLNLQVDASINVEQGRAMAINTDSFKVVIFNASGIVVKTFEYYKDLPNEVELDTGSYYVVANSNNETAASFENAYYYGQSIVIHVSPKEVVPVSVTCELYNFFVTVEFTSNVIGTCNDWSTKIWNDEDTLEFVKGETRKGYFKVAPVSILAAITYTKSDSSTGTILVTGSISDPHRKTHYIITIDAQINGSIKPIEINVDESSDVITLLLTNYNSNSNKIVDIDGNIYNTVQIGTQTWMKENLTVTKYRNGDPILNEVNNTDWANTSSGAYCFYNNDANNGNIYGALYNYYAVIDPREVCPSSWHIPSDNEWKILEMNLGLSQSDADSTGWRGTDQGSKMKNSVGWNNNGNGTNSSGFSGLPGGNRYYDGNFDYVGRVTLWWSSTLYYQNGVPYDWAYRRCLDYQLATINRANDPLHYGFSVRCVKD